MRLWLLGYAVGREIPPLGIAAGDVLLHAQEGGPRCVFPVAHVAEFPQVGLGLLFRMLTAIPRSLFAILNTPLALCFRGRAVAHVCFPKLDQLFGHVVQLLEVIA